MPTPGRWAALRVRRGGSAGKGASGAAGGGPLGATPGVACVGAAVLDLHFVQVPPAGVFGPRRGRGRAGRSRVRRASCRAGRYCRVIRREFTAGPGALTGKPASVDGQDRAVDVLRRRRREEDGGAGDVGRLAPAAGGDALEDRAAAVGVGAQGLGVVGLDVARRDGVDVDALRRPLVREQPGQPGDPVLGGGVGRDADAALEGEQRGDVDDGAAGPPREDAAGERLGEEEDGLEVDVDDLVPVGFA